MLYGWFHQWPSVQTSWRGGVAACTDVLLVLYVGAVKCSTLSVPGCVAGAGIVFSVSVHLCVYECVSEKPSQQTSWTFKQKRVAQSGVETPAASGWTSVAKQEKSPEPLEEAALSTKHCCAVKGCFYFLPSDSKRYHGYLSLESNYRLDIFIQFLDNFYYLEPFVYFWLYHLTTSEVSLPFIPTIQ